MINSYIYPLNLKTVNISLYQESMEKDFKVSFFSFDDLKWPLNLGKESFLRK